MVTVIRLNHSPLVVDLRNDPGEVAARVSLHGAALQLPSRRAVVGRGHCEISDFVMSNKQIKRCAIHIG